MEFGGFIVFIFAKTGVDGNPGQLCEECRHGPSDTRPKWSSHASTWKTGGMCLVMLATVSRNTGWFKAQLCDTDALMVPAVAAVSRVP